jgi:dolichol-phosphate mannosyltransferase
MMRLPPGLARSTRSRLGIFTVVGIFGYGVQTAVLWVLVGRNEMAVVPATLAATEAAVLHNFLWHLGWTWADRPAGARAVAARLARFNLSNGGFSLVGGAAIMALLVDALGVHYLLANLAAVLVVSVVNFLASDRFVFTQPSTPAAAAPRQTTYKTTAT